jgi:hypothetical protein
MIEFGGAVLSAKILLRPSNSYSRKGYYLVYVLVANVTMVLFVANIIVFGIDGDAFTDAKVAGYVVTVVTAIINGVYGYKICTLTFEDTTHPQETVVNEMKDDAKAETDAQIDDAKAAAQEELKAVQEDLKVEAEAIAGSGEVMA